MTVFEVEGGPRLELPEEPVDIQDGLRDALLDGQKLAGRVQRRHLHRCSGCGAWWRPALEPGGLSREDFVDTVIAYRRELWLWLMGDRQWFPFITGLAGRIVRRLPVTSDHDRFAGRRRPTPVDARATERRVGDPCPG